MDEKQKPPSPYWWLLIFPLGIGSLLLSGAVDSTWPMGLGLVAFAALCWFMSPKSFAYRPKPGSANAYRMLLILPVGGIAGIASAAIGSSWPIIVATVKITSILFWQQKR